MKSMGLKSSLFFLLLLSAFHLQASPWTSPADTITGAGTSSPAVATNAAGASIAAYVDGDGRISAKLRATGKTSAWGAATQLSTAGKTVETPIVAINANGDAIAVWENTTDKTQEAAFRPAATAAWSASAVISTVADVKADESQIAMNDTIAVGVWRLNHGGTVTIESNTFTIASLAWGTPGTLSDDGAGEPQVAINADSTTAAIWEITRTKKEIEVNTRALGASWNTSSIQQLSDEAQNASKPIIGIDSSGNLVAVWDYQYDGTNYKIQGATGTGATWNTTVNLSGILTAVEKVRLAIDGNGDAAAVWSGVASGNSLRLVYAAFLKTLSINSWTAETTVSRSTIATEKPQVGMDTWGNAIVVWNELVSAGTSEIIETRFYQHAGSIWNASEIVAASASGQKGGSPVLSVGSGGNTAAVWDVGTGAAKVEEAAYFTVSYPALNVTAKRKSDRFLGQKDLVNHLRGNNDPNITPVSYTVYQADGTTSIETVPTSTMLKFEQHNRKRTIFDSYQIVTNNSNGGESFPFLYTVTK